MAPAARARSIRSTISSRSAVQYIWNSVRGLAATTSSTGLEAKLLNPISTPRAAAARATASSPSGCTACTPVGEITTGMASSWPSSVVASVRTGGLPATCGATPSSRKASSFSATVWPRSDPATSASYTGAGSRLRARRCATATDSNHGFCRHGFSIFTDGSSSGVSRGRTRCPRGRPSR